MQQKYSVLLFKKNNFESGLNNKKNQIKMYLYIYYIGNLI